MTNHARGALVRALLLTVVGGWSFSAAAADTEHIHFRRGEVSGTVRGSVSSAIKTWQFRARKDQQISVTLVPAGGDKGLLTMTLYAYCGEEYGTPLAVDMLQWEGKLPCDDRYTLDVAPSVDAMREGRLQRYVLRLTIR